MISITKCPDSGKQWSKIGKVLNSIDIFTLKNIMQHSVDQNVSKFVKGHEKKLNRFWTSGVYFDPFTDIPVFPTLSQVGRWGSHAPIWYIFLTNIFEILKMSSKRICMFSSQNIVQRPRFCSLHSSHFGGPLGFLTKSIIVNHFELDTKGCIFSFLQSMKMPCLNCLINSKKQNFWITYN